jgi:NAD(P)H-nitrite reductase large subunit
MELDEELCLCFHVSKRKVVNYIRIEKPRRTGELSHCHSAGTGCGWCVPFLEQLFNSAQEPGSADPLPGKDSYAEMRAKYRSEGKRPSAADDAPAGESE